jgi:hypothetical protein
MSVTRTTGAWRERVMEKVCYRDFYTYAKFIIHPHMEIARVRASLSPPFLSVRGIAGASSAIKSIGILP